MTAWLAGVALGLVGSGHCAAMCGPLVALAAPARDDASSPVRLAAHVAFYHLGRALIYLLLGALIGTVGGVLARSGLGRGLAIVSGMLLLGHALASTRLVAARVAGPAVGAWVTRRLAAAGKWMRTHRVQGPMVFGALNGLLPCGLVYAALTAAAGLGDAGSSVTFMAGFAIGTTPVLAVISSARGTLGARVPQRWRRLAPVAVALVGVLLIVRGVAHPHVGHAGHGGPASQTAHQH